jgi:hypothetical protein
MQFMKISNAQEEFGTARLKAVAAEVARRILAPECIDGEAVHRLQVFQDLAHVTLEALLRDYGNPGKIEPASGQVHGRVRLQRADGDAAPYCSAA